MQRVIICTDKEIDELKRGIVNSIHEFSKQSYGFKMVSRDTGEEITDADQVRGMLFIPIDDAFSIARGIE